jgi:hypothetical protein
MGGTPGSLGPAAWTSTSPTRTHPERGTKHLDGRAFALATVRVYDVWIDAVGTRLGDAQPDMPDGVTDRPTDLGTTPGHRRHRRRALARYCPGRLPTRRP